ncbi:hypothetical protein EYZ11_010088 [Aspergillus tanneri]|uniref:Uncharacterized protein n=1 Tax=Aspergillus tanneri TaxID=1220188 RepID=A0A4S3J676_9EURO|nr:hypothetical protein EYZ11_010088 [Aspergillus tanneri]
MSEGFSMKFLVVLVAVNIDLHEAIVVMDLVAREVAAIGYNRELLLANILLN